MSTFWHLAQVLAVAYTESRVNAGAENEHFVTRIVPANFQLPRAAVIARDVCVPIGATGIP